VTNPVGARTTEQHERARVHKCIRRSFPWIVVAHTHPPSLTHLAGRRAEMVRETSTKVFRILVEFYGLTSFDTLLARLQVDPRRPPSAPAGPTVRLPNTNETR